MNYLVLLFIIIFVFIILLLVFNQTEFFSQDIKTRGQKIIEKSNQSLTGYFNSLKDISNIRNREIKDIFMPSFTKFKITRELENRIKSVDKVLNCEDGNFMNPNFELHSTCDICQPSFYCINAKRYQCPLNTWSNSGATECLGLSQCPTGFMCTNKIQENCPTGYFCTSGVSNICPTGSYCSSGNRIICPTGTFNELTGKFLSTDCLKCSTGYYCTSGNGIICPTGSYCTDGIRNICPEGRYNPNTGSTDIKSCILCPAGSFCINGFSYKCGFSTWSDEGSSFCNYRDKVPPGYHYDDNFFEGDYKNDKNHVKIPCDPGYYCIDGLRLVCPDNTWSEELESSSKCKPMSECPEGNTCGTKKKVKCATGTWSNPGQSTCSPVSSCPAGSSCVTGRRVLCGTGTWSDTGAISCLPNSQCPTGSYIRYTNSTGTFTGGIKVLCEEGFRCINGTRIMCQTGQFSTPGSSSCMLCPPGSSCRNGIRTLCGTGTFSDISGSTECKYCPIMSKTTGPSGDVITRNFNVKTLNSTGTEVFQGASQCKLAEHNQNCSNTDQCGLNNKGNKLCCAYWRGSSLSKYPSGNYCADPDSWKDWVLTKFGKYDKCMTGPVTQINYPYVKPGEIYNTIVTGP